MLRIALVTYGGGHEDLIATEKPLIDAFAAIGPYTASMHVWSDASVQWRDFDVVLVRCTWDYHKRLPEFVAWLRRVDAVLPGRLLNPVSTLVWNMDKAYLVELRDSHPGVVHIANSVIVSPPSLDGAWTAEQLRCVCDDTSCSDMGGPCCARVSEEGAASLWFRVRLTQPRVWRLCDMG